MTLLKKLFCQIFLKAFFLPYMNNLPTEAIWEHSDEVQRRILQVRHWRGCSPSLNHPKNHIGW